MKRQACPLVAGLGLLAASFLYPSAARAQQTDTSQQPTPPIQPVQPVPGANSMQTQTPEQKQPTPAPTAAPILGGTDLTFALPVERSYLLPTLSYYGQLNSNAYNALNSQNYTLAEINSILGSLVLQKSRPRSQLNLGYLGGGTFSATGGSLNSLTQAFSVSQGWNRGRWAGAEADEFSYSSGALLLGGTSPFDLAELGQLSGLSALGPILIRNAFRPSQSIFTPVGPRLTNALIGQVNYQITARTSATAIGSYDVLHFFQSGLVDSYAAGFQTGIGHQLTRRDSIAAAYRFNSLWFNGTTDRIQDNVAELAYERTLTRRLDLRVGGGPDITPINSSTGNTTRTTWAGDAMLRYTSERMNYGLFYNRGVTGGSGIFLGAATSVVSAAVQREVSRLWSLTFSASYARNTNLIGVATSKIVAPAGAKFDAVYGGVLARRQVGESSEMFLGYTVRRQTSDATVCSSTICGSNLLGNVFNFGFVWRPNRIPFD